MNFNFGEVLSRAWQITWKHKVLWVFGILAGCTRGGTRLNVNQSFNSNGGDTGGVPQLPPQLMQVFEAISENVGAFIGITLAIICLFWIVAIFLGTIGRIGLIRGTWQVEGGAGQLVFGQLFSESQPYFWRMFGLSILINLPVILFVAVGLAGGVVLGVAASQGGDEAAVGMLALLPLFIGCFCLLVPIMFVIGMIARQAENAIVLEDARVFPSISRGWDIFRANLGNIFLMAIILVVIGLAVGFAIAIPVLIVVVPAMFSFMAAGAENWNSLVFAGICLCLYIPVSLLLNGVLITFTEAAWTLTYMRLVKPQDNAPVVPEANA
ncbi:MAG: hypothetical protein WCC12_01875 [Anaerolineales bacterium]